MGKVIDKIVFDINALSRKSKNKTNKSMPVVYKGTGKHKSIKDYTRKKKHKKKELEE